MPGLRKRITNRRHRIVDWMLQPVSRAYVAVLFVLFCFVVAGGWAKITNDEHQVCEIQARSLEAGPFLVGYLENLHSLTALPPDKVARQLKAQLSHARFTLEFNFLFNLNWNLAHYLVIIKHQPKGRAC